MRAVLSLLIACAGVGTSLYASGLTAKNHEQAERLHGIQRECELRRAAIADMRVQVRGRVAGNPRLLQEALRAQEQGRQVGDGVSGSKSLGGSPVVAPDTSTPSSRDVDGRYVL